MSVTNLNARTATRNTIKSSKKKTTAIDRQQLPNEYYSILHDTQT